jgi:hypothetical protein
MKAPDRPGSVDNRRGLLLIIPILTAAAQELQIAGVKNRSESEGRREWRSPLSLAAARLQAHRSRSDDGLRQWRDDNSKTHHPVQPLFF